MKRKRILLYLIPIFGAGVVISDILKETINSRLLPILGLYQGFIISQIIVALT